MLISTIKSGLITSLINVANADQANTDRFMFRMAFAQQTESSLQRHQCQHQLSNPKDSDSALRNINCRKSLRLAFQVYSFVHNKTDWLMKVQARIRLKAWMHALRSRPTIEQASNDESRIRNNGTQWHSNSAFRKETQRQTNAAHNYQTSRRDRTIYRIRTIRREKMEDS